MSSNLNATIAATPMSSGPARTPLSSIGNKSQSFGTVLKPVQINGAAPAPSSSGGKESLRKSLGALPSSTGSQVPNTIIPKRLSVVPSNFSMSSSATPAVTPAASRLSIAPTPASANPNRKSFGPAGVVAAPQTPGMKDPRRSSVYGTTGARGKGSMKADPRPVGDKAYVQAQIKKVITFLADHGWNQPISPKVLQSPTAKDFISIVLFVYRMIDTTYTIEGKVEEEIPAIFRNLRYPIAISKSSMQSIGAPHTWPALLAALEWLCDNVTFLENQMAKSDSSGLTEGDPDMLFDFIAQGYESWLQGEDNFSQIDNDLAKSFETRNQELKVQVETIKRENDILLQEVDNLRQQGVKLEELGKLKANLGLDIPKFEKHIQALEAHGRAVNNKFDDTKRDLAAKEAEREQLTAERANYQEIIRTQEMNAVDVEKLNKERTQLEEGLRTVAGHKEIAEKALWDTEMSLSKKLEELEANVRIYNSIASRLSLIPGTAKRANGKNFDINQFSAHTAHLNDHVIAHIRAEVAPGLAELKASVSDRLVKTRDEALSVKELLETHEDTIAEKAEEMASLEASVNKLEESYKAEKEAMAEKMVIFAQETQALQQEIARAKANAQSAVQRSQKSLETLQAEYEALITKQNAEKEQFNQYLLAALDTVMNHKAWIQDALEALKIYYSATQQQLLSS